VLPAWELEQPEELVLRMEILRNGDEVFAGKTSIASMRRPLVSLVDYLFRSLSFPTGVALLTGTGIVPPDAFTLAAGDVVSIGSDPIGTLENPVVVV